MGQVLLLLSPVFNMFTILVLFLSTKAVNGGSSTVPAMFVFGDSLVDDGNNNYMTSSLAKANYYPYGLDFYQGATGRFTNGKTVIDLLCEMLDIPYIPPFNTPNLGVSRIARGVNYASAAGGILDESGFYLGERYSLSQQVLNFEMNLSELRNSVGVSENLKHHLARSVVVIVIGSNDYINNYLLPSLYASSHVYRPQEFANLLINALTRQILTLNSLGLKKFFIAGLGPLGCIPNQRSTGEVPPDRCVDGVNEMIGFFNDGLKALVDQLNLKHPGSIFVYGNTYGAIGDILNNPEDYGFEVIDKACCGVGRNRGEISCLPLQTPCSNRNEYVFWDAFHPTEAVNVVLAQRAFNGPPSDCYPINIDQMARL